MPGTCSEWSFDPILCTLGVVWAKSKKKYFWPPVHGKLQVRASLHSGHKFPVFVLRIIYRAFFHFFWDFWKIFFSKIFKCIFRRLKCVKESKHGYLESNEYIGCFCGHLCDEGWPFSQTWFWALAETPQRPKIWDFQNFFFNPRDWNMRKIWKNS